MASLRTTVAWCFRVRVARAKRLLLAFVFAVLASLAIAPNEARAQFVPCSVTLTDISCINSIDVTGAGVFQRIDAGSVNITLQNLPTGLTDGMRAITTDGNALTQNQGQADGLFSFALGLGFKWPKPNEDFIQERHHLNLRWKEA